MIVILQISVYYMIKKKILYMRDKLRLNFYNDNIPCHRSFHFILISKLSDVSGFIESLVKICKMLIEFSTVYTF